MQVGEFGVCLLDGFGVCLALLVLGQYPVDAGQARVLSFAFAGEDDQVGGLRSTRRKTNGYEPLAL